MSQKSGYLYKKGSQTSGWQQRLVTLSTETGTMKFFAEKSGNKVPKGQVCIKQGKVKLLDLAETGHAYAFEIRMEELIGKSDEAVQTLSVDSQQQLDQWLEWIGLACSLDRRKGSLSVIESLRTLESKDEGSNTSLGPRKSLLSTMFPQIESECIDNSQPLLNSEVFAVSEATQGGSKEMFPVDIPNPVELELAVSVSDSSVVPQTDAESADAPQTTTAAESEMILPSLGRPAKPLARKPSRTFMPPVVVDSASEGDLVTVSAAPLVDPEFSPDGKNLAEKLEAKLEARRKVFKPPNFKNLLNSNGFDTIVRKSHAGSETGSETDTTPPSRSTAAGTPIPAEQQHGGVGIASARRSHSPNHTAPHSSNARRHGHGHGLGQDQQGHGNRGGGGIIEGADSSHASSAAPSPFPNTEHHNVEASPATPLLQPGDALAPRRSFSKSPARRRTSKKATHQEGASTLTAGTVEGHDTANSSRAHTPSPTPPSTSHAPLTRHLKISVRPTEAVRMGYLYRLDTSPSHDSSMGSDVWLTQFVSMDITTGMMHVYAEINGKRLQRAKFDINESSVKSIDQLFHSRLYCFKVSYRPEDANEKKVSAVFAAEDEDSLNYWLVSFEDCEIYYHTHGGDKKHAAGPADTPVVAESTARAQPSKAAPVIASGGGTSEVGSDIGSGGSGGGKISPADLANALRKRGGGMAAEPKDEGEDKYDDTYTNSKNNKPVSTAAHANPLVAALHSRFASAPANVPQHPHQGEDPSSAAVEVDHSASTESLQYNDQLLRVNTMNMDTLLSMPNKQVSNLQEPLVMEVAAPLPAAPAPLSAADSAVSKLKFSVKRVKYPSERLSRRIKIWYCSSGFSIASVSEVEQFVAELRNTGDAVLSSFAEEKFGDLQDWANLLAVLRKYEQRRVIDSPVGGPTHQALDGITFEIDSVAPVEGDSGENKQLAPFNLCSDLNTAAIATQISKELGASESLLAQELPRMLLSQEDNVVSQGLILLNEDLAFAEDLILYQEEVINNVWGKYLDLQAVVAEKEDTISQMYAKISHMQQADAAAAAKSSNSLTSISHPKMDHPSWHTEKEQLLLKHTEEKLKYITEIQMLRKSLSPEKEQILKDLRQVQQSRDCLETEVIHTQSRNDELRAELAAVKDKLQAAEEEKAMMEAHWLEEIKKLKAEHERHAAQLREETRKAQVQTKKAEEAVVHRRNSEIAAAIQHSMHQQHSETPPSPPPLPAPSPPTAPPAFTAMTSIASIEEPKAITMTSRFTSPKRTHDGGGAVNQQQSRQNKTYVNMYAVADEVTTANAPPPKGRTSSSGHGHGHGQAPKLYNAFSYSAELKEDGPLSSVSKKESPQPWVGGQYYGASSGGFTPSHNISSGGSVNGSISSRREELIDPEDENQEPIPVARFTPPIYPQQNAPNGGQHRPASQQSSYGSQVVQPADSSGMKNSFSAPNLSAQQLSLRMKRLPQSGTSSPMTPLTISSQGTSFSPGPSPNPNGLQVPRSLMKSSSIRGMIQKQNSATAGKVAGPYMAPHGVAYTVASSAESTPREAPATPSSVSSTAGKNFMSSTKAVKINQQLLQESAKEKFMKKFTFNKTGI